MKLPQTLIEQAARGICIAMLLEPDRQVFDGGQWTPETAHMAKPLWMMYIKHAKAALEAALSDAWMVAVPSGATPKVIEIPESLHGKLLAVVPLDD